MYKRQFLSRRILETLIFGALMGIVLLYANSNLVDGTQEMIYAFMENDDFVWLILNCALLNICLLYTSSCV